MRIRLAEEQDHPFLVREYLQHMSPDMEEAQRYALLHLEVDRALLLEDSGFIMGLLTWGVREGIRTGLAQITGLRVISSRRRQGHGRALLEAALQDMETYFGRCGTSCRRVFCFVPEGEAVAFLERTGFVRAAELEDHREAGRKEIFYTKQLL